MIRWTTVWKVLVGIGVVLSLFSAVLAFDNRYAKEKQIVQTLDDFGTKIQLQTDYNRLGILKAQRLSVLRALQNNPDNTLLNEELGYLNLEIANTEERIQENLRK